MFKWMSCCLLSWLISLRSIFNATIDHSYKILNRWAIHVVSIYCYSVFVSPFTMMSQVFLIHSVSQLLFVRFTIFGGFFNICHGTLIFHALLTSELWPIYIQLHMISKAYLCTHWFCQLGIGQLTFDNIFTDNIL